MDKCSCEECDMDIWDASDENLCIFHDSSSDKPKEKFKKELVKQLEGNNENDPCWFLKYHFPTGCCNLDELVKSANKKQKLANVNFEGAVFEEVATFFDLAFGMFINFQDTTFKGCTWFNGSDFNGHSNFSRATFLEGAIFSEVDFNFSANFKDVTFKKVALFKGAEFHREASFDDATFGDLGSGRYNPPKLSHADEPQNISTARRLDARFGFLAMDGVFSEANFEKTLSLHSTVFLEASLGEKAFRRARGSWESVDAREEADYHYRQEMINKQRQLLPKVKEKGRVEVDGWLNQKLNWFRNLDWGESLNLMEYVTKISYSILNKSTGYGTRVSNLLVTWGFVIFFFWFLYLTPRSLELTNGSQAMTVGFLEKLYFSIVTFTTLGLGDIKPTAIGWKLLTGFESVLGGILMAALVLVLGRKFMR